jgi:hypothetical protein
MIDPDRISRRDAGLAAQLLRAGATELPSDTGVERTLAALGVSGAVLGATTVTSAAVGSAKAAGAGTGGLLTGAAGTAKVVSATLLVKWVGVGVVGGVGLAGVLTVATAPPAPELAPSSAHGASPPSLDARPLPSAPAIEPTHGSIPAPEAASVAPVAEARAARPSTATSTAAPAPASVTQEAASLAAELAFVDRARNLLSSGRAEQGLALLSSYEAQFPESRLLPEVLFLRLETCEQLGRPAEARAAARRLVESSPNGPHAARARRVLFP